MRSSTVAPGPTGSTYFGYPLTGNVTGLLAHVGGDVNVIDPGIPMVAEGVRITVPACVGGICLPITRP